MITSERQAVEVLTTSFLLQRMADEETTAQVHPEKLTNALLEASKQAGSKLTIGTVEGITSSSDGRVTGGVTHFPCPTISAERHSAHMNFVSEL